MRNPQNSEQWDVRHSCVGQPAPIPALCTGLTLPDTPTPPSVHPQRHAFHNSSWDGSLPACTESRAKQTDTCNGNGHRTHTSKVYRWGGPHTDRHCTTSRHTAHDPQWDAIGREIANYITLHSIVQTSCTINRCDIVVMPMTHI